MSKSGKIIMWIVIAVVVIGGGIWWWMASQSNPMNMSDSDMSNMNGTPSTASSSANMPQGDSDQAIEQDMTSANAQMDGFSSDSASIDQGINDQPIQQGQ